MIAITNCDTNNKTTERARLTSPYCASPNLLNKIRVANKTIKILIHLINN